jgi:serine/threonine protein phosphatase PrpC
LRGALELKPLSLDDNWKKTEIARKLARNEWFVEECARVNEKKIAAIARALGDKTRYGKNAYTNKPAERG